MEKRIPIYVMHCKYMEILSSISTAYYIVADTATTRSKALSVVVANPNNSCPIDTYS